MDAGRWHARRSENDGLKKGVKYNVRFSLKENLLLYDLGRLHGRGVRLSCLSAISKKSLTLGGKGMLRRCSVVFRSSSARPTL